MTIWAPVHHFADLGWSVQGLCAKNDYKRRPGFISIDNAGTSTKVCLMSNFCYDVSNFQQVCFYEWPDLDLGMHQSSGPNAAWIRQ